jgi:hypothetical protein
MAVIVNDFEVVSEPTEQAPPPAPAVAREFVPSPLDLERLLAEQRARAERVRAY